MSRLVHVICLQARYFTQQEMWALFDWTHHGMLLGTARTFQTEYNKPITRAREKCATYGMTTP